MRLGGSLRRTRRKGGESARERWMRRLLAGGPREGGTGGRGRLVLQAAGLGLAGWLVGYLIATQIVFPAPPPPTDLVQVPDVRGTGIATARERLQGVGLDLGAVDSLRHPSVASGLILGQSPLPGQLAKPGTGVRVTRSLGPQLRAVPDMRHVDADRARIVLETSGFVVVVDSVEAEVPRGRVVQTRPSPDQTVALPTEIHLQVSKGPPLIPMPLVLGLTEADAVAVLDSLGLAVGEVREVFRFGRDQGIVVEQEPPADSLLQRGTTVRLSVGRRGG
jgi:eukaryotic-like serine/threonine-protein kinase